MKKLIKQTDANTIEVLGADNKYYPVSLDWDEHDNLSDRTREQVLATGMLLHLGLPVTDWNNCIDDFMELFAAAMLSHRLD